MCHLACPGLGAVPRVLCLQPRRGWLRGAGCIRIAWTHHLTGNAVFSSRGSGGSQPCGASGAGHSGCACGALRGSSASGRMRGCLPARGGVPLLCQACPARCPRPLRGPAEGLRAGHGNGVAAMLCLLHLPLGQHELHRGGSAHSDISRGGGGAAGDDLAADLRLPRGCFRRGRIRVAGRPAGVVLPAREPRLPPNSNPRALQLQG
mmetsp:Transcript_102384/g.330229  ORF Transcript_102384/g.330229 Transcript_102384/m.330229 type:complete len:206 (+) Transcript_102384:758-1375(+)